MQNRNSSLGTRNSINIMNVKKDDKVIVLTGKDKGKSFPKENRVIVSGVNILKVHQKPRKSGEKGQILDKTMPIDVSNVKRVEARGTRKETRKIKGSKS